MDLRTGKTYETREAALAAGVPESDIAEIVGDPADPHPNTGEIVRFASGPFKDRTYRRRADVGWVGVSDEIRNALSPLRTGAAPEPPAEKETT